MKLAQFFGPAAITATAVAMSATPADATVNLANDQFAVKLVTTAPGLGTNGVVENLGTITVPSTVADSIFNIAFNGDSINLTYNGGLGNEATFLYGNSASTLAYQFTDLSETLTNINVATVNNGTLFGSTYTPSSFNPVTNSFLAEINEARFLKSEGFSVDITQAAAVPEPATWALMGVGVGLMGAALRRRPKAFMPA